MISSDESFHNLKKKSQRILLILWWKICDQWWTVILLQYNVLTQLKNWQFSATNLKWINRIKMLFFSFKTIWYVLWLRCEYSVLQNLLLIKCWMITIKRCVVLFFFYVNIWRRRNFASMRKFFVSVVKFVVCDWYCVCLFNTMHVLTLISVLSFIQDWSLFIESFFFCILYSALIIRQNGIWNI